MGESLGRIRIRKILRNFGAMLVLAALSALPAQAQQPATPEPVSPVPAPVLPGQQAQPNGADQQQQPAQNQPPRQLSGTTTGWVKVCQKFPNSDKEGCSIE